MGDEQCRECCCLSKLNPSDAWEPISFALQRFDPLDFGVPRWSDLNPLNWDRPTACGVMNWPILDCSACVDLYKRDEHSGQHSIKECLAANKENWEKLEPKLQDHLNQ